MKRTFLGVALAVVLAALPLAVFAASTAEATTATTSTVRIPWISNNNTAVKMFITGTTINGVVQPSQALKDSGGADPELPAGTYTVWACPIQTDHTTGSNPANLCRDSANNPTPGGGAALAGGVNNLGPIGANNSYMFMMFDTAGPNPATGGTFAGGPVFASDLSLTGINMTNVTIDNYLPAPADICLGPNKVATGIPAHTQLEIVNQASAQGVVLSVIVPPAAGCNGNTSTVNLVAGTNFVLALAPTVPALTANCTSACTQVLLVGAQPHPNSPDQAVFCSNIVGLASFQSDLKALIGSVDPTNQSTIIATQPSVDAVSAFVTKYTNIIAIGDATVPVGIQASWATATAGLRALLQTFQIVGYQLSNLPVNVVQELVEGANGQKLPGVPPNANVVDAQAALTYFVQHICLASSTPTSSTPAATPTAAQPAFTG